MPAGGIANPHPVRDTTRPAIGPVCGEPAGLDKREAGKTPASAPFRFRKRGSGAESAGYGRFGECRGEAPEGERAPVWRASAPVHR